MSKITKSERLFEKILSRLNIKFDKVPETHINQTNDYIVGEKQISYWELKGLVNSPNEKKIIKRINEGKNDSYSIDSSRIINSIKNSKKQLKLHGEKGIPCIILLCDERDFSVKDSYFHNKVKSMLLGRRNLVESTTGKLVEIYIDNAEFKRRKKYISAIAILEKDSEKIYVYHNPYTENEFSHSEVLNKFTAQYKVQETEFGHEWIEED